MIGIKPLCVILFCYLINQFYSFYAILFFYNSYVRYPLQLWTILLCKDMTVSSPIFTCSPLLSVIKEILFGNFIYLEVLLSIFPLILPLHFCRKYTPALSQLVIKKNYCC